MTTLLTGKVALISGATTGIGLGIAQCFVTEGATVVITGHTQHAETKAFLAANPATAQFMPLEVTAEADWQRVTGAILTQYGHLDVVVNNAGVFPQSVPVDEETLADWNRVIGVNLTGTFLGVKYGMRAMKQGAGGSIINISSVEGLVAEPNAAAYNASKGGVRLLTKAAALDATQAGSPIRVNSVHPGFIKTNMIPPAVDEAVSKLTPQGHTGTPEDIGNICVYLASDKSRFATGAEFVVDGGFSAQ